MPVRNGCTIGGHLFFFSRRLKTSAQRFRMLLLAFLLVGGACLAVAFHTLTAQSAASANDDASLLGAYGHVEVASVSDALEQVVGKKMYMSRRMRPIFPSKFAGIALTVHLKKEENDDPAALSGMLAAIDAG